MADVTADAQQIQATAAAVAGQMHQQDRRALPSDSQIIEAVNVTATLTNQLAGLVADLQAQVSALTPP